MGVHGMVGRAYRAARLNRIPPITSMPNRLPSSTTTGERLKLRDAVTITALVTCVAGGLAITVAALIARQVVIDTIDTLKRK